MIKNIIKTNRFLSVTLEDGTVLVSTNATKELLDKVMEATTDDDVIDLINPQDERSEDEVPVVSDTVRKMRDGEIESEYIEFRGNSAYIPSISELTVPQDFVDAIAEAEANGDEDTLQSYLNFWTLVSLNPDSRVRENLFWFIKKWNVKITKGGMLVTYRNADFKKAGKYGLEIIDRVTNDWLKIKSQKKSPKHYFYTDVDENGVPTDEARLVKEGLFHKNDGTPTLDEVYELVTTAENVDTTTFTDHHSHTFTIKIGQVVSMPREEVNGNQEESCSHGLHQGAPAWLTKSYYGDTGLVCLVNPAMVCAVPHCDDYGKMRVCEYLPIAIAHYDETGHVIEDIDITGLDFEDKYLVEYSGKVNNEDFDNYTLNFVRTIGIDREEIARRIFDMAKANWR